MESGIPAGRRWWGRDGAGQLQKALTQQEVGLEWRFREDAWRPGRLFPARSDSSTDEAES